MISPLDTRIAYFGGAGNPAATDAVIALADAGFRVVVASHDPHESVALRDAGLEFFTDRHGALSGTQVVITSLRTPDDVEDAYLGDNGLLELMAPGTYAIDVSFSTPQLAREIYAMGAVSDIEVLDAPIVNLGEHEQAIAFIGGNPDTQATLSPLFPYLAPTVIPQAEAGDGQFAAMIAYVGLAGALMGAIESLSLARVASFPQDAAINALASTSAGSRALVDFVPRVLAHDYSGTISVSAFLDVLEVVLETADGLDMTVPMIETAYQLYELLRVVGGGELSIQALALLYEDERTCAEHGLDWALADAEGDEHCDGSCSGGHDDEDDDEDERPPFYGFFSKN